MNRKALVRSSTILVGTAIGAGVFALPYTATQYGIEHTLWLIVVVGALVTLTMLAYGVVTRRQTGSHQLVGYTQQLLGKRWKKVALVIQGLSIYGALLAYIQEIGVFFYVLLGSSIGGSPRLYSMLVWVTAALIFWLGLQAVARFERWFSLLLLVFLIVLSIAGIGLYNSPAELTPIMQPTWNAGYGVILFAIAAFSAIPEMRRYLAQEHHMNILRPAILAAMTFVLLFSATLTIVIVSITGQGTSQSALAGLAIVLPGWSIPLLALFGIIAIGSSMLMSGLALQHVYQYDISRSRALSWLLVVIPPVALFWAGALSFTQILSFIGAVAIGAQAILIWELHGASRRQTNSDHRPLRGGWLLERVMQFIFLIGVTYEITTTVL